MKIISRIKNHFWPNQANKFQPYILNDRAIALWILLFLISNVLFSFQLILVQQSALFAELNAQKIIVLTNELRKQYGLAPLQENILLDAAARQKAEDMSQNNYFSHFSPTGISPWHWIEKTGYNYRYAGENLAMNFIDSEEVVRAWFNSAGHRENLLNKNYQEIGIAVLPADLSKPGMNQPIVVQLFGAPQAQKAEPTTEITKPVITQELPVSLSGLTEEVLGKKEVLSEEGQKIAAPTTTTAPLTATTIMTTTTILVAPVSPVAVSDSSLAIEDFQASTRSQIDIINKIIAFILIILGLVTILGIILNRRDIPFNFSEIILRSGILIFIGAAFLAFHLEQFIGRLVIS